MKKQGKAPIINNNNDFSDDDVCTTCNPTELDNLFAQCPEWTVSMLKLNLTDLSSNYVNYTFTFNNDGTLVVRDNSNIYNGTWVSSVATNGVDSILTINVAGLTDFNANWQLINLNLQSVTKRVELRIGINRLSFTSECNI